MLILIAWMSSNVEILMHFHSSSGGVLFCWQFIGILGQNAGVGDLCLQTQDVVISQQDVLWGTLLFLLRLPPNSKAFVVLLCAIALGMDCFRGRFSKLLVSRGCLGGVAFILMSHKMGKASRKPPVGFCS